MHHRHLRHRRHLLTHPNPTEPPPTKGAARPFPPTHTTVAAVARGLLLRATRREPVEGTTDTEPLAVFVRLAVGTIPGVFLGAYGVTAPTAAVRLPPPVITTP
ncbi:hypothetical protein EASAB2608_00040 [Streptomyces sp. EAS-AB2608]|nr:hypothetical protein EASAB2608_00040 [Streptomyces sp. EAS-AB2608]